ncbi:hypothetical protein K8W59_04030 [Nocardioides rotundus]|uniref:M57 family metalloprotease n=1 Tax=Nocardioides rotundus TaxID=1774216 RepID=UPI001CC0BF8B|nr:M57 family metalloprotease [Nocardioides rotundus]UAL30692.1 hypothetical protein K8W59_04030 [Nocardioides rotundus]
MLTPLRKIALATAALTSLALAAPASAQVTETSDGVPTFKEFQASTYQDADRKYIVNGDEPVRNTGELREFYNRLVSNSSPQIDGLIVNTVNGQDDRWSQTQVANLTYCVSTKFGKDYTSMVNTTANAAALWERASSAVDFRYVASQDGNCTTSNNSVVFSVEPTKSQSYIARAFFPSYPKSDRNVLVNVRSLNNSSLGTPTNIMGHELGHILGFRHEHTRPEAGTCFENNSWRPLTPYDSASIMHYPQCNGTSSDMSMTASDVAGVQALYGP